jgi:hypothetical protein
LSAELFNFEKVIAGDTPKLRQLIHDKPSMSLLAFYEVGA